MAYRLSDLAPDSEPEDLAAAEHRCASPEPLPVLGLPDADEGERLSRAVAPALSDCSSEGLAERDAVPQPLPKRLRLGDGNLGSPSVILGRVVEVKGPFRGVS